MSPVPIKGHDTHELFPELFEPPEQCNRPKPLQKQIDAARKLVRRETQSSLRSALASKSCLREFKTEAKLFPLKEYPLQGRMTAMVA